MFRSWCTHHSTQLLPFLRGFANTKSIARPKKFQLPRSEHIYRMSPLTLRKYIEETARRGITRRVIWDAYMYRAVVVSNDLQPTDVALIIYALSRVAKRVDSFIEYLLKGVRANSRQYNFRTMAVLLTALAKLRIQSRPTMDALFSHALQSLNNTTADKDLALFAQAYVRLNGIKQEIIMNKIAGIISPRIDTMTSAQTLTLLLFAFAQTNGIGAERTDDVTSAPPSNIHRCITERLINQINNVMHTLHAVDVLYVCMSLNTLVHKCEHLYKHDVLSNTRASEETDTKNLFLVATTWFNERGLTLPQTFWKRLHTQVKSTMFELKDKEFEPLLRCFRNLTDINLLVAARGEGIVSSTGTKDTAYSTAAPSGLLAEVFWRLVGEIEYRATELSFADFLGILQFLCDDLKLEVPSLKHRFSLCIRSACTPPSVRIKTDGGAKSDGYDSKFGFGAISINDVLQFARLIIFNDSSKSLLVFKASSFVSGISATAERCEDFDPTGWSLLMCPAVNLCWYPLLCKANISAITATEIAEALLLLAYSRVQSKRLITKFLKKLKLDALPPDVLSPLIASLALLGVPQMADKYNLLACGLTRPEASAASALRSLVGVSIFLLTKSPKSMSNLFIESRVEQILTQPLESLDASEKSAMSFVCSPAIFPHLSETTKDKLLNYLQGVPTEPLVHPALCCTSKSSLGALTSSYLAEVYGHNRYSWADIVKKQITSWQGVKLSENIIVGPFSFPLAVDLESLGQFVSQGGLTSSPDTTDATSFKNDNATAAPSTHILIDFLWNDYDFFCEDSLIADNAHGAGSAVVSPKRFAQIRFLKLLGWNAIFISERQMLDMMGKHPKDMEQTIKLHIIRLVGKITSSEVN